MSAKILLAHGSGGALARELIEGEILTRFQSPLLSDLPDAATLPFGDKQLLFATDSFVVQPLFFPGGNIGDLAVHGTVNDLAVAGGRPLWLSLSLVLEEGLELKTLQQVLDPVKRAADSCGVSVVTGDTKVVNHGHGDGIYINTAGVGERLPGLELSRRRIIPGDCVLVSGTLGDHGMAVMTVREQLPVRNGPISDTGPVHRLAAAAAEFGADIKFMRDPTRGGLAAVLNEMVSGLPVGVHLYERRLPFGGAAQAVAELIGMDLLQVACEGRVVAVCSQNTGAQLLAKWQEFAEGRQAALVGDITAAAGEVCLETVVGGTRLVAVPAGELLPRIC